jgi:hypothetical protein
MLAEHLCREPGASDVLPPHVLRGGAAGLQAIGELGIRTIVEDGERATCLEWLLLRTRNKLRNPIAWI